VSFPRHQLSRRTFSALAAGGGGAAALEELTAAEYSKHMTLLIGVVKTARAAGHEQYPLAMAGLRLLDDVRHKNPAAAEQVILHPPVALWARQAALACRHGLSNAHAQPAHLAAVGAAAAIRGGLPRRIEIPAAGGWAVLPSLGAARALGTRVPVRTGLGQARIGSVELPADPHQNAPGWLPLRRVHAGGLDVIIDDLDPFRMRERADLAPRLAAIEPWETALTGAWAILTASHSADVPEIRAAIRTVVPLTSPLSGTVSDSSPEAFGAVAMSLPLDPVTGAEALVHETQHLKLGALLDLAEMTLPDDGRRYYAPWRDDPRPVSGLFQGAYAHLGVTAFWRRQRLTPGDDGQGHVEYVRWRDATAGVVETLRSTGRLTGTGRDFVDGMARVLDGWRREPVPGWAADQARQAAQSHRSRWEAAHGPVPVS
jgi:uncharacterized protein